MKLIIGINVRKNVNNIKDSVLFQVGCSVGFIKERMIRILNILSRSIHNLILFSTESGKSIERLVL